MQISGQRDRSMCSTVCPKHLLHVTTSLLYLLLWFSYYAVGSSVNSFLCLKCPDIFVSHLQWSCLIQYQEELLIYDHKNYSHTCFWGRNYDFIWATRDDLRSTKPLLLQSQPSWVVGSLFWAWCYGAKYNKVTWTIQCFRALVTFSPEEGNISALDVDIGPRSKWLVLDLNTIYIYFYNELISMERRIHQEWSFSCKAFVKDIRSAQSRLQIINRTLSIYTFWP